MIEIPIILLFVILASALQGFSGFGFGLVLMSVLPFIVPVTTATIMVSFTSTFIGFYMVWRNREHINFRILVYPLVGSLLFIPVGVTLLNGLDEVILKRLLGSLLIVVSLLFLLRGDEQIRIKPGLANGVLVGSVAGILNGMLSVGGPPLVMYFLHATEDKFRYKVSIDVIFLITSIYRLGWLFSYGMIGAGLAPLLGGSVLAGLAGTFLGFSLMIQSDRTVIRKAVYVIMIFAGASLILL